MMVRIIALSFIMLVAGEVYGQHDSTGIRLDNVDYPYPVHYMKALVQQVPVEIAYMDVQPKEWNGKCIMLLHGKNFPSAYWGETIKSLSASGYRVVAPDALGFGKSSKPIIQYSFSLLALLTEQLLDTLHISKTAVLGHSTGGMLATRFTLTYPRRVTRLILEDPIGLEDWRAEGATYRKTDDWYNDEKNATYDTVLRYHKQYYANWKEEYRKWADVQYGMSLSRNAAQAFMVSALTYDMIFTQPVLYEFPDITVPTLVMVGKQDRTKIARATPEEITRKMGNYPVLGRNAARNIPGARLIEYDSSGHLPHFERRDAFLKDLKDFLSQ